MITPTLTTEQQQIVLDNIGLIGCFIRKFMPPRFIRMADYEGEMMLALCQAVLTWNPNGGARLSTWAFHKFMGARSEMLRKTVKFFRNEKQGHDIMLSETPAPEIEPELELTLDQQVALRERVESLDDADSLLFSQDRSVKDIAEIMQVTPRVVYQKRRVLLRRLAFNLRLVFPRQFRRENGMKNGSLPVKPQAQVST